MNDVLGTVPHDLPAPARMQRWPAFAAAGLCIAVWAVYLLAFWPALMTDDSIDQWFQVLTGQLTGHHPRSTQC